MIITIDPIAFLAVLCLLAATGCLCWALWRIGSAAQRFEQALASTEAELVPLLEDLHEVSSQARLVTGALSEQAAAFSSAAAAGSGSAGLLWMLFRLWRRSRRP